MKNIIIEKISLMQERDCCDGNDMDQRIQITFHDGGGGYFWRIEHADRWSMDVDSKLFRLLNVIANRNTRIMEKKR